MVTFIEAIKLIRKVNIDIETDVQQYSENCPCCGVKQNKGSLCLKKAKDICDVLRDNGIIFHTVDDI